MNSQSTWSEILGNLLAKRDLTRSQAAWAMGEIMAGRATDSQVGGFLLALRSKGETSEEISGFVDVM
ncbi:MAG: anthranilate phosphoribosyltransferase, partial [Microbacteriaceae bacterium]|nr:anthranilate phosphoribosyltransferase [Microbacteriaceae bacterium]